MATLDNTIGVLFEAAVISAALYGGSVPLLLTRASSSDFSSLSRFIQVTFVIVCDTCQQAILTACAYSYLITNFANLAILNHVFSTLIIEIFFSDFIAFAVQLFYCYRLKPSAENFDVHGARHNEGAVLSCNIAAAVPDALISTVLVYYLYISKTGFAKTDDMLNRLIAFTFNTGVSRCFLIASGALNVFDGGLPTSFCALAACISINVAPQTFVYIFWFLLQGRFYTNTLLVTLNIRDYTRSVSAPGTIQEIQLTDASAHSPSQGDAIAIRIDRMSVIHQDFARKMHQSEQSATGQ
ncbi:hypothetical protein B0H11DRAFT_2232347 [Mycena galericulata]|nr:hypothetical protein B0H11DRAFT_2232347 [Mycena galericulata]